MKDSDIMKYLEIEAVELKRNLNDTFEKELVAFLNTCDGTIYLGVEDDGTILGIDNLDKTMLKIADIITNNINPNPQELVEVSAKMDESKWIIEVKVKKGISLYYIKSKGRSANGCFVRIGTSCRSMTEEQIEKRFESIYFFKQDITQIESNLSSFSFRQLKIYYGEKSYHLNDETFENNLGFKTKNEKYNLLAELLSDTNRISIKIARFRGSDKSELIEKSEYGYQCLLVAIDRMINRLEAENYTMSVIKGAKRYDKRLLDMESLREIFINSIAHNDWTIVEPAVYIFDDRIEIISHGGLPNGQTKEMFFKGVSTPRNKALMRILSDLDYVEQTGHGIPEVVKKYGNDIFDINDNYINVTLPFDKEVMASKVDEAQNEAQNEAKNSIEEILISLIKENSNITRQEMIRKTGKSRSTIERILRKSTKIFYVGSSKKGHWQIKD